jgi:GH35 family endo-1,4-beta-xylanase
MSSVKAILAITVAVLILVSCGGGAPAATQTAAPTDTLPAASTDTLPAAVTANPTLAPTLTPAPAPKDVPVYRTSFEDMNDLADKGITSNANITITTDNVNYTGGAVGSKDLEVSGTLPGAQWSYLSTDFSMKKLIGEESLDLSNKTVAFSFLVPQGSPISDVSLVARKGDKVVVLSSALRVGLDFQRKGWVDISIDVENVYANKSWPYTNATDDDEARDVIKGCDTLSIQADRNTAGTDVNTAIYVDDLNWIGIDKFNIPVDDSVDSLRKYAASQHFKFGLFPNQGMVVVPWNNSHWYGDPWYAYMAAQEGAVNVVWPFSSKPNEDYSNFDYDRPEDAVLTRQYQYGEANHMAIQGYGEGSIYHDAPQWLQDLAFPDATRALLLYHIEKDVSYAKGMNPIWFLFNETINTSKYGDSGLKNRQNPFGGSEWDYSPWAANTTDTSLIEAAFLKARQVDPGATLMINDVDNEQIGITRSEFEYQLISGLKDKGIPIDGVGFQLHNYIDPDGKLRFGFFTPGGGSFYWVTTDMDTYLKNVDANVKRYASIGMKVAFTEVEGQIKLDDIDFTTPVGRAKYDQRLQWQARYYAGLLKIAQENDNVILFNIWGITDKFQNPGYPGYGNGFIFDKNYNPKPAYYALLELLKNNR